MSLQYLNVLVTVPLPLDMFTHVLLCANNLQVSIVHGLLAVALHVIFVNLLCTTEGINRQLLIGFLQLCTCAVQRTVLKGHTNKSNLSLADSIPTRCSIAPASTCYNSPPRGPSEALQRLLGVCGSKVSRAGLILSHYCSSCNPIFFILPFFFFFYLASQQQS